MGDHEKKSESKRKVKAKAIVDYQKATLNSLVVMVTRLEERVIRMERAYDALGRRLEGSERHVEDEGWFD